MTKNQKDKIDDLFYYSPINTEKATQKEQKRKTKEREKRIKQQNSKKKVENQFDYDNEMVIKMTNKNNQKKEEQNKQKMSKKQRQILKKKNYLFISIVTFAEIVFCCTNYAIYYKLITISCFITVLNILAGIFKNRKYSAQQPGAVRQNKPCPELPTILLQGSNNGARRSCFAYSHNIRGALGRKSMEDLQRRGQNTRPGFLPCPPYSPCCSKHLCFRPWHAHPIGIYLFSHWTLLQKRSAPMTFSGLPQIGQNLGTPRVWYGFPSAFVPPACSR